MPIPTEYEGEIIRNGMLFMRTITNAYGAEEGMRLWDTIASTLDPDIKGKIFVTMLIGGYSGTLVAAIDRRYYNDNRVEGIKAIRAVTGYGLKEAKDAHDDMLLGKSVTLTLTYPEAADYAIRELAKVSIQAR